MIRLVTPKMFPITRRRPDIPFLLSACSLRELELTAGFVFFLMRCTDSGKIKHCHVCAQRRMRGHSGKIWGLVDINPPFCLNLGPDRLLTRHDLYFPFTAASPEPQSSDRIGCATLHTLLDWGLPVPESIYLLTILLPNK